MIPILATADALTAAAAAPLVVALVEAAKRAGLPAAYAPIAAVAFAIPLVALLGGAIDTEALVTGIVAGLSAAGLYSGTKAVAAK